MYVFMAIWVTYLMIADEVIKKIPYLCSHEFFVGNIAPDSNVENERKRATELVVEAIEGNYVSALYAEFKGKNNLLCQSLLLRMRFNRDKHGFSLKSRMHRRIIDGITNERNNVEMCSLTKNEYGC